MTATVAELVFFSNKENTRTYVTPSHTAAHVELLIQRRVVPSNQTIASALYSTTLNVVQGTVDSSGAAMREKYAIETRFQGPIGGAEVDIDRAIERFRAYVADPTFVTACKQQLYING